MTHRTILLAAVAALPLAACNPSKSTGNASAPVDPMAENISANQTAKVELPPAIRATNTYRCEDNSIVYADLFKGDTQVALREDKAQPSHMLRGEAGKELTADGGYAVTVVSDKKITVTRPGHKKQACTA